MKFGQLEEEVVADQMLKRNQSIRQICSEIQECRKKAYYAK